MSGKEAESVIEHKLSSFYPGNPSELCWDYILQGNKALLFFAPVSRIKKLRDSKKNLKFYSSWHLCASLDEKNGIYAYDSGEIIDLFTFQDNLLREAKSVESSNPVVERLEAEGVRFLSSEGKWARNCRPLFLRKKTSSLLIPNLVLFTGVLILALLLYWNHVQAYEDYNKSLKKNIQAESVKRESDASLNREMENALSQIERLQEDVPLNIWNLFADLSESLGTDVQISKLTINKQNFQMEAIGNFPLKKMEKFSNNPHFHNVIPYQIKAIEDSTKESFFLTGAYGHE